MGEVVWEYRAGRGGVLGGIEWGSRVDGERAYFAVSDILLPQPGGLHAVTLATGQRAWFAPPRPPVCGTGRGCNAAQSAAVTVIPGAVFSGSNDGAIRVYSTTDGAILWEFDTNREFTTVNGRGGTGRLDDRSGTRGRRRHGVRQLRIRGIRRTAGERVAGLRATVVLNHEER
jgi:polyvinyl alcohol dehydrogenase (cytochrome)